MLGVYIEKFKDYSNEELVKMYHETRNDLIVRHLLYVNNDLISLFIKKYFLKSQDREDLVQEIQIGFGRAIINYDDSKQVPFRPFAYHVIKCRCVDSIIKCNRLKNISNVNNISLQTFINDEERTTIQDTLEGSKKTFPEYVLSFEDNFKICNNFLKKVLTDLEYQVWTGLIWGITYKELSEKLQRSLKSIDNAFQRSKKMIRNNLDKYDITYNMIKQYIHYLKYNFEGVIEELHFAIDRECANNISIC